MPIPVGFHYQRSSSPEKIFRRMYGDQDWLATTELSRLKNEGMVSRIEGGASVRIPWHEELDKLSGYLRFQGEGGVIIDGEDILLLSIAPYSVNLITQKVELYSKWGLEVDYNPEGNELYVENDEVRIGFYLGATDFNYWRLIHSQGLGQMFTSYEYAIGAAMVLSDYPDLFSEASQRGILAGYFGHTAGMGLAVPWSIARDYIAKREYTDTLPQDLLYPFCFPSMLDFDKDDWARKGEMLGEVATCMKPVVVKTGFTHFADVGVMKNSGV